MTKYIPHPDFVYDLTGHSYGGGGGKVMDLFDGDTTNTPLPFRDIDTSEGYPNYKTHWDVNKGIRFLIDLQNGDDLATKPVIQRLRYFQKAEVARLVTFRNADAAFAGITSGTNAASRKAGFKTLIGLTANSGNVIHQFTTSTAFQADFTQVDISNIACRWLLIQFANFSGAISELEIYTAVAGSVGTAPVYVDNRVQSSKPLLKRMGINDSEGNLAQIDFKGARILRRYNSKSTYANDTTNPVGSRTVNLSPFGMDYDLYMAANYNVDIMASFKGKHAATGTPPNTVPLNSNQINASAPVNHTADDPEDPDNYTEDAHLVYCLVKKYGHDTSAPTLPYRINHDDTPGTYGLGMWKWFEDGNEDEGQGSYTPLSQFARCFGNQAACKAADPNMPYIMGGSVRRVDEYFKTFAFLCHWFAPAGQWIWDGVNVHEYYNELPEDLGVGAPTLEQRVGKKGKRPENGDWAGLLNSFRLNISRFPGLKERADSIEWFLSEFGSDTYPNGPADATEAGSGVTTDGTPIYGSRTPQESQAITLLRFNLHIMAAKFDYPIQYQISNYFNVADTNNQLFATMGLLQNRQQPSGAPWAVPGSGATSIKKPAWYFYAQLESQLGNYKFIERSTYSETGLNVFKFVDLADANNIALYCYKGSQDGSTVSTGVTIPATTVSKISFSSADVMPTTEAKSVAAGTYTDTFDEKGALLKYSAQEVDPQPVINVFAAQYNGMVAKSDGTFASIGVNSSNTAKIIEFGAQLKSFVPGRPINGITGFQRNKSYYWVAIEDMDQTANFVPPLN